MYANYLFIRVKNEKKYFFYRSDCDWRAFGNWKFIMWIKNFEIPRKNIDLQISPAIQPTVEIYQFNIVLEALPNFQWANISIVLLCV